MHTFAAAGAAFLLAVVWLDLMFDVQSRKHATYPLPTEVLASISAYYRRVTTEAYPMNWLVRLVMWLTLSSIVAEMVEGVHPWWIGWVSLVLVGGSVVIAARRAADGSLKLGGSEGRNFDSYCRLSWERTVSKGRFGGESTSSRNR